MSTQTTEAPPAAGATPPRRRRLKVGWIVTIIVGGVLLACGTIFRTAIEKWQKETPEGQELTRWCVRTVSRVVNTFTTTPPAPQPAENAAPQPQQPPAGQQTTLAETTQLPAEKAPSEKASSRADKTVAAKDPPPAEKAKPDTAKSSGAASGVPTPRESRPIKGQSSPTDLYKPTPKN